MELEIIIRSKISRDTSYNLCMKYKNVYLMKVVCIMLVCTGMECGLQEGGGKFDKKN